MLVYLLATIKNSIPTTEVQIAVEKAKVVVVSIYQLFI
jgi:hypothetical protein